MVCKFMTIVAGVDFGTLSGRFRLAATREARFRGGEYPLDRKRKIPNRPPKRMRTTCERWRTLRARRLGRRRCREPGGGDRPRYHRIEGGAGGREYGSDRRLLPVVRSPRVIGSGANHADGPSGKNSKPSSGAAGFTRRNGGAQSCCIGCATIPTSARAWPGRSNIANGGGHAVRGHRPGQGQTQRVRHGAQVDVASWAGRAAVGRISGKGRSAAGGRARQAARRL